MATQSSDRSVHIYSLKTKDGQFSLDQYNKISKMDLPGRRISSESPAPPDPGSQRASFTREILTEALGSPRPSAPGTPQSLAIPFAAPPTSHSRRSSISSQVGQSMRRSVSPSPSAMPLPAFMPSASPSLSGGIGMGVQRANIYANETFTSFFRRLTFAPDGSLMFTPAGQYKTSHPGVNGTKGSDDIINTVYIYTRAGLNKPPVAYLPGHKRPSVAVKCSPVFYHLRVTNVDTKEITIDTRTDEDIPALPEPAVSTKSTISHSAMDPPPLTSAPSPSPSVATMASPRQPLDAEQSPSASGPPAGPPPAFGLPYRIVYAVATQDAVLVYDTQQHKPICVVSNLHYATFTDLTWSSDGLTLLMTSSDGFCSALTFMPSELGSVYHASTRGERHTPAPISVPKANSSASTPQATPTATSATSTGAFLPQVPNLPRQTSVPAHDPPLRPHPSHSPFTSTARPASPARSMSASSIGTEASFARVPDQNAPPVMNFPAPSMSSLPNVAATGSGSTAGGMPLYTPPQTPGHHASGSTGSGVGLSGTVAGGSVVAGVKRESGSVDDVGTEQSDRKDKRRRIAPTLISEH